MRLLPPLILPLALCLGLAACTDEPAVTEHTNALTGQSCIPDTETYMDRALRTRTTQLDCTGETTDIDHPDYCCTFPQPGCDADGCCDADLVEPPGID